MTESTTNRHAVVIPGGGYGPQAPLLAYAADAAEARRARVHPISWTADPRKVPPDDRQGWVAAQVAPVLDELETRTAPPQPDELTAPPPAGIPLLIGKSFGTYAAALAADRGLPAVWLTPLLTNETVVASLRQATAPALLVGGTADPLWDGQLARQLSPYVLEVTDADHGMYLPGPLAGSAAVLGRVATAVEEFLDDVLWR
ncbi:alpha/beta hydrolase [Micromonospora sp. NPDC050417]|uniref:alpha/beta hydrolase n=1 Tax=Micromonospora sp. NPDC050417 TaxID=3364280 RepID=UPI0037A22037